MRAIGILLALGVATAAHGRHTAGRAAPVVRRVAGELRPQTSPGGGHIAVVQGGALLVDGRLVHAASGAVEALVWRADGGALAWIERGDRALRLVVLPDLEPATEPLVWTLPAARAADRIYWTADNRVVVGAAIFAPRAVASWE